MIKQDKNEFLREGLETARCPTGVGSNPTPRTRRVLYPNFFGRCRLLYFQDSSNNEYYSVEGYCYGEDYSDLIEID